ncbi:type VI secretion system membrane subunit TssM [Candidatus Nitrospira salsa]
MRRFFSLPKNLFLALLSRPHLLVAIGVILLCLLIWFGGTSLGLQDDPVKIVLIGGILLSWILLLVYDRYRAKQGARLLEQSLHQQSEEFGSQATSDQKDEIEAVRTQFQKAMSTLKQTKLGKQYRGQSALYALPWYMFIGPSASGKSTALRESGLHFPYLGENRKGVQGVGGTRNCDWWFTSEAVLLDTAGRYTTEEEDREEWFSFLDLLKKYRKHKPINGVIVAISIADLLQGTDQDIESHAKTIRERIDELMTRLGMVFPVYLVFTKCDLLDGFVQFFGNLSVAQREQIWGSTLKRRTVSDASPQEQFDGEFCQLLETLQTWRLERLMSARGSEKIRALGFPLQFATCQTALHRFVELLFHQNPYQESPFFRGFYFTSGTQEGNPIDRIIHTVSEAAGLQGVQSEKEEQGEPKSYFIKNLFTDVIFPDRGLSNPSSSVFRQRGYVRVAVFGAAILGVGLSLFGFASSYLGNKFLIGSVLDEAVALPLIRGEGTHELDSPQYITSITGLDRMRERVEQLSSYDEGSLPIRLWGFYEGDRLVEPLKTLYRREFDLLVARPVKKIVESQLGLFAHAIRFSADTSYEANHYSLLKAYLMMADNTHLDSEFLDHQLQKVWSQSLIPSMFAAQGNMEVFVDSFKRILRFYSYHMAGDATMQADLDQSLIQKVRSYLRRIPVTQRLYAQTLNGATEPLEPFSLDVALEGKGEGSLISEYQIPGIYTRNGWKVAFRPTLSRVLNEFSREYWVLGETQPLEGEVTNSVQALYFGDYSKHWQRFLQSVHVRSAGTVEDVLTLMEQLSVQPSPITLVLQQVRVNTGLMQNAMMHIGDSDSSFIQKMKRKLLWEESLPESSTTAIAFEDPVYREFRSIHRFVDVPPGQEDDKPPVSEYVAQLQNVRAVLQAVLPDGSVEDPIALAQAIAGGQANDLTRPMTKVEQLSLKLDPHMRRLVEPLLLEPLTIAMRSVMNRSLSVLNAQWESEVFVPCQQTIAGRYPFQRAGQDVALNDVSQFFHPQSGVLWAFFDKQLKPFIHQGQDGWRLKPWRGVVLPISETVLQKLEHARFLSESLFPSGQSGPHVEFDLFPYPDQGLAAPLVSEIRLALGEQEMLYQMGPQEWEQLVWPGISGSGGAALQVKVNGAWEPREAKGWWGLFRLLDGARITPISDTAFKIEWAFQSSNSKILHLRYDLKARSARNPFHPDFFEKFSCTSSLKQV